MMLMKLDCYSMIPGNIYKTEMDRLSTPCELLKPTNHDRDTIGPSMNSEWYTMK